MRREGSSGTVGRNVPGGRFATEKRHSHAVRRSDFQADGGSGPQLAQRSARSRQRDRLVMSETSGGKSLGPNAAKMTDPNNFATKSAAVIKLGGPTRSPLNRRVKKVSHERAAARSPLRRPTVAEQVKMDKSRVEYDELAARIAAETMPNELTNDEMIPLQKDLSTPVNIPTQQNHPSAMDKAEAVLPLDLDSSIEEAPIPVDVPAEGGQQSKE